MSMMKTRATFLVSLLGRERTENLISKFLHKRNFMSLEQKAQISKSLVESKKEKKA